MSGPLVASNSRRQMSKHKKRKKKRHRPYEPVKMKFVKVENPLRDAPADVRRKAVLEVAAKARVTFDAEYPKIVHWFDTYDPIYILAFCVFYFLTSERGVDKEAVQGTLEFPPHYLELLQAFALMRDRLGTPAPLGEKAEELLRSMRELGSNLALAKTDYSADATDSEVQKRYVLAQMRAETLAIRNWAFPDQTFAHLKALFAGQLNDIIGRAYRGVSAIRIIDTLVAMMNQVDERLNSHFHKLRAVVRAKDFDSTYREYRAAFPMVSDVPEGMRRVFTTMCGGDLRSFLSLFGMHPDLHLEHIFTFSIDEIMQAYGEESHRDGVLDIFNRWALEFRDLAGKDPKHFLYSNPVLQRPFIRLGGRAFFWVLSGVLAHTLPGMLEALVPPADRQRYSERRSD